MSPRLRLVSEPDEVDALPDRIVLVAAAPTGGRVFVPVSIEPDSSLAGVLLRSCPIGVCRVSEIGKYMGPDTTPVPARDQ